MSINSDTNNNNGGKNKILKIARGIIIAVLTLAGLFVFFNYLIFWFLPFITAWIIALMIQPAVNFLHKKIKIPKNPATILFLLLLFIILGIIIFFIIDRIFYELSSLSKNFSLAEATNKVSDIINNFFAWLEKSLASIPVLNNKNITGDIKEIINTEIINMLTQFSVDIVSQIPSYIKSIIITIPKIFIYTLVTIVSTFYISFDYQKINKFIAIQLPEKARNVIIDIKSRFLEAIYKYIKAYFTIFIIAYSELTAGFLIIGINYAFSIALLVAVVDILPIIGMGAVLIPWGIIAIIQKDYFTGFALLILYSVILIIRNIIEPKIVGSSIGLYPVVTLISMFVGYNIIGFAGIFLFPIIILILKNLNDEGKINIWKNIKKDDKPDNNL
ncbi:MAG: sporulation integral membrane protein YtvI [Oscillospiraceae bacterium]|nr:sporulation integral membrane protein YtvI [Oscillospiraceae bacterium]